jgi:S-adenosylmethionine synthetase
MTERVLVTGATGLLGRQVVKAFESARYEVTGIGFSRASPPKILKVDIQNVEEVEAVLEKLR